MERIRCAFGGLFIRVWCEMCGVCVCMFRASLRSEQLFQFRNGGCAAVISHNNRYKPLTDLTNLCYNKGYKEVIKLKGKLTVQEVAQRLGIKEEAVRERVRKGALEGKRQPGGKRIWFSKDYIDDLAR